MELKIEYLKLKDLKPYDKNPRKNDDAVEYVANSIKEFGFKVPIVIDKDNIIVAGHTRYRASEQLGLTEVPCVVANDLEDEQIRAFRLADNKVSEKAEWNFALLDKELNEILDIDMSAFDFDIAKQFDAPEEFLNNTEKSDAGDDTYFGAERERTFEAYNMYDIDQERLTKKWEMPTLKKCTHIPKDLLSFNYAKTSKEYEKGIHFYIDDYQFERIWNAPHGYMELLKKFDCVLTPDFSLYTDMPLPMQIWNVYRSKLIGQIMQDYEINVIPTLQWCLPNSYDFAFEGIETGGTVSVSTIGVKKDENANKIWFDGMDEAIKRLKPKNIIVYGGDIGYEFGNINVVYINNHNAERLENGR